MWCDGRRKVDLPPGARVEVRRGSLPVLLARVHAAESSAAEGSAAGSSAAGSSAAEGSAAGSSAAAGGGEFTDRMVAKFGLPVAGWRGRSAR
jgi:NAD+ kinase